MFRLLRYSTRWSKICGPISCSWLHFHFYLFLILHILPFNIFIFHVHLFHIFPFHSFVPFLYITLFHTSFFYSYITQYREYPEYNFFFLSYNRVEFLNLKETEKITPDADYVSELIFSFANLFIAVDHADFFVGSLTSSWCAMMNVLQRTRGDGGSDYLSVDGGSAHTACFWMQKVNIRTCHSSELRKLICTSAHLPSLYGQSWLK